MTANQDTLHPVKAELDPLLLLIGKLLILEGNIGAGKTSLGRSLEQYLRGRGLKVKFFTEYRNNVLLSAYIDNMAKYAFAFQLFMLSKRVEIYRMAQEFAVSGGLAIIDRSIIGDRTFARMQYNNGLISEEDWQIYNAVLDAEINLIPDVCLYLNLAVNQLMLHIERRGIAEEVNGYTVNYIQDVTNNYFLEMAARPDYKVKIVDWDNYESSIDNKGLLPDATIQSMLALIVDQLQS